MKYWAKASLGAPLPNIGVKSSFSAMALLLWSMGRYARAAAALSMQESAFRLRG